MTRLSQKIFNFAVFFMMMSAAQSATVVLDFNVGSGVALPSSYSENGFTLDLTAGHYDHWSDPFLADTAYIGLDTLDAFDSQLLLTGGVFDLVSLELLHFSTGFERLRVTSSAGGNVSLDANIVHAFSGTTWTDLTWVNFSSNAAIGGPGFDNLTLNTVVPVPAAAWLFASALGLLGWIRRKAA